MRRVIIMAATVCLSGCTGGESSRASSPSPPASPSPPEVQPPPSSAQAQRVVGLVHRNGRMVCDAQGNQRWENEYFEVGFTRLVTDDTAKLEPLLRKPVVAHGRLTTPPPTPAATSEPRCPIPQLRSDWVQTPEGIRMRRSTPTSDALVLERIEPWSGLQVARVDDQLRIQLTNQLGVPLGEPVEIRVHYEGCYGKPGTIAESNTHDGPLNVGASWSVDAPILIEESESLPRRRNFRAYSIEVIAHADALAFDFDALLEDLGQTPVRCPND